LVEACRPPTVEEVAEAAVLDPTSSPPFDPENRFFDPQSDILEILGSLVSVVRRGNVDEAADLSMRSPATTVSLSTSSEELRLSHFSVKEYLFSVHMAENMDQSVRMFHAEPHLTSSFVLESCLQYIFHYAQSEDRESNEDDLEQFPLLGYACAFWHVYASPAICGDKAIADSLNRLFSSEEVLNVWLLVYAPDQPKKRVFEEPDEPGQPLHYASSLGLTSVCRYLLGQEADVNGRTESGITPLHRSAEVRPS
jgi:cellobiose-specific phosphotransferase system component IIA